ncbi:MAG: TVP38/TMEM64 family protein [gamma proteobacterium symbiont of Bathyaustriella thionipta]|nr:TVP38/TMEM64 family protein [gamma proteobacterium symbiont of Bathyaustriella thionipta]
MLVLLLVVFGLIDYWLDTLGIWTKLNDSAGLKNWMNELGWLGPLLLMALMALAIIINPIPSAPIAVAAGAVYGHTWGTVYVVAGATTGAIVAFFLSRLLGYELLRHYLGDRVKPGWLGSQNSLSGMVLVSRLIPFISFDLVSYGAGLTPIKPWRFVLATLVGLVPVSFLLAHFGEELAAEELHTAMLWILGVGMLTLLPVIIFSIRTQMKKAKLQNNGKTGGT